MPEVWRDDQLRLLRMNGLGNKHVLPRKLVQVTYNECGHYEEQRVLYKIVCIVAMGSDSRGGNIGLLEGKRVGLLECKSST
jgi:hypothetical protein